MSKLTWVAVMLVASACHTSSLTKGDLALAAIATTAAVATNAAQAAAARAAAERPTSAALVDQLVKEETSTCATGEYARYCTPDRTYCVYRTQYGFEHACPSRDCADGPPASLRRWCGD